VLHALLHRYRAVAAPVAIAAAVGLPTLVFISFRSGSGSVVTGLWDRMFNGAVSPSMAMVED